MKKQDELKLDIISGIDEKIIDEVTDKRISLSKMLGGALVKTRKRFMAIGISAASLVLVFGVLAVILIPLLGRDIPVYQGMTVRNKSARSLHIDETYLQGSDIMLLSSPVSAADEHKKDEHKGHDEHLKNNVEDLVTIEVITDETVKYYVQPGETFIIEIHISNPDNFEIQSFTLNGKKYANYMFEEGSTMELLLLEVTAPKKPGYVEYTIDAIKYIDGTEIKDVDMSKGNKSVKVGVAYTSAPSASVTVVSVLPDSVKLSVDVIDRYSLTSEKELSIYLSDGEKIIASKPLKVGKNEVTFDGLTMSKTYEYGVAAVFDMIDGKDLRKEWLCKDKITTAGIYGFENVLATQNSISFEITKLGDNGKVTSVSLYDAATDLLVASGDASTKEFSNLLSGHTYNLYVDFTYTLDGKEISEWSAVKNIQTAPYLEFVSCSVVNTSAISEGDTIFLQININNPNKVVFKTVVINGKSYDVVKNTSTDSMLVCEIVNKGQFEGGETLLTVEKIISELGGKSYTFEPREGNSASVFINGKLEVKGFEAVVLKNGEYVKTDYYFPDDKAYLMLTLSNKTGYSVDSLKTGGGEHSSELIKIDDEHYLLEIKSVGRSVCWVSEVRYSSKGLQKTELCYIECEVFGLADNDVHYVSSPDDLLNMNKNNYYELTGDIDLSGKEWHGNEFSGVLDGKGYSVKNMSFVGTLTRDHGNLGLFSNASGIIMNLDMVGVRYIVKPSDSDIERPFGSIAGCAAGLTLENCTVDKTSFINIDSEGVAGLVGDSKGVGGLVGFCEGGRFINCSSSAFVSGKGTVGGIAGYLDYSSSIFINCENSGAVSGKCVVGGIAGGKDLDASMFDEGPVITFENCKNYGNISGENRISGIMGIGNFVQISNCANYGNISSSEGGAAGIVSCLESGNNTEIRFTKIKNCINYGSVVVEGEGYYAGGIVGFGSESTELEDCVNFGTVSGYEWVGGIIGATFDMNMAICQTTLTNCVNYGSVSGEKNCGSMAGRGKINLENCYVFGEGATLEDLNSKSFYTDTLGWDPSVWNLDDLDVEKGKYPTLK